jgi:hypothetical protein
LVLGNYLEVWAFFLDPRYEAIGAIDIIRFFRSSPNSEGQPNIDAAVLRASVAAVVRAGEETVMAAGRRVRMIVAILRGWIRTIIVVVGVTLHRRMIVVMVLIVMLLGVLVAVVFLMILRAHAQRHDGTQRERRDGENDRLPRLMMHGIHLELNGFVIL